MLNMSMFFTILAINSYIVTLDSIIKIAKKDTLLKKESEILNEDRKDIVSFVISFICLLAEIIILSLINLKNLFFLLFLLILLGVLIYKIKHKEIEKLHIFYFNHIIFDILLLIKPLIIYIYFKI